MSASLKTGINSELSGYDHTASSPHTACRLSLGLFGLICKVAVSLPALHYQKPLLRLSFSAIFNLVYNHFESGMGVRLSSEEASHNFVLYIS
jgi:hypothetical protein